MLRISFLLLWIIPALAPQAHAVVEIYVNGHKYGSLQEYLVSKKIPALAKTTTGEAPLRQLYVLGVENGVAGALRDFYQTWGQSDLRLTRSITSKQLQEAIAQAVTASKGPKLLISGPGKVRIMVMSGEDSNK